MHRIRPRRHVLSVQAVRPGDAESTPEPAASFPALSTGGLAYNLALYLGVLALNGRPILGLYYHRDHAAGRREILKGLHRVLVVLNASVIAATFLLSFCALMPRFVACRKLAAAALDRVEGLTDSRLPRKLLSRFSLLVGFMLASLLISVASCYDDDVQMTRKLESSACSSPAEPLGYLDNALTLARHTVALVSITDTVSKVEKESKLTGAEASDLMDTFDHQSMLYDKLSHFTTYNQFSQLKLRVFDFFPMNQTLLLSMLQTISTYVFINIQFALSSEQQKQQQQQTIDDDIAAASYTTASSTLSLWSPSTIIATTTTDD
ncbi:hypothetical protein TKK_0003319 [Trichogramma kaykai]